MKQLSRRQELDYTGTAVTSFIPSAKYPFAAATEYGEIFEAETFEGLIAALDDTQPTGTECVLFVAQDGKWVEKDDYTTKEEEG